MISDPLIGMTSFDAFAKEVDVMVMIDRAQRDQLSGNVSDLKNSILVDGIFQFPLGYPGPAKDISQLRMD